MRSGAFLIVLCLFFISCKNEQAGICGFPFKITADNAWGMIAADGNIITINAFAQQPSVVVNNRFTLPDGQNKYQLYCLSPAPAPVTPRHFTQIGYYFEEVTVVQEEKDAPLLLVDPEGNILRQLDHYNGQMILMAHNFSDKRALIYTENQKYGYIDTEGEMVIRPVYDMAYDFSKGLAIVGIADEQGRLAYQVINRKGEIQFHLTLQNCRISSSFSNGLLSYKNPEQGYCAYLNPAGKTVLYLPARITESGNFQHEAAIFLTDEGAGLLDKSGKIRIPANYEEGEIVGPDRVALKLKGKWALFDFNGKPFCEFTYDRIYGFQDNGTAYARRNQSYVRINDKGQPLAPDQFAVLVSDDIATRRMPQIFTRHTPGAEQPEEDITPAPATAAAPSKNIPSPDPAWTDQNNPFYAEARKVLAGQLPEADAASRKIILDYMEYFRSAYTTKDLPFLEQLFSEDALIVVGKVVRKAPRQGPRYLSSEQIVYNLKSKREYLQRLKAVFEANKQIRVRFRDFNIKKHPTLEGIYGVSVKQNYTSDLYSDEGYLFLLWDFRDKTAPQIHVRTWQPRMLDEHTPLPEQEIFSIRNFNLE